MPYVLKNNQTSQVFTMLLTNHYQLSYYGTKYWETAEEGEAQLEEFLVQSGVSDTQDWSLIEVSENQMKMFNVRLKNDPRNLLYVEDGKIRIQSST
jgi:hypothetical protein